MAAAPVKPVVAIVTTRMTPGNPKAAIFLTTSSICDRTSGCEVGIDEAFSAYLSPDYPIAAPNSFSFTVPNPQIVPGSSHPSYSDWLSTESSGLIALTARPPDHHY
jgi:hypothetical protein